MKYHVAGWVQGDRQWYTVSQYTFEKLKPIMLATSSEKPADLRRAHEAVLFTVHYTPANKTEMKQHAEKLAAYLEEVDTAKEAVIRCTKI